MTELRQKMIREMDLKNLSPHTKRSYLAAVAGLSRHYQLSPDTIPWNLLKIRFAKGEIDIEEFLRMKQILSQS